MDINNLVKERASLWMQIRDLRGFMEDPLLREHMRAGVARVSSVLGPSGRNTMETESHTLESALQSLLERLGENAVEIERAMSKVQA